MWVRYVVRIYSWVQFSHKKIGVWARTPIIWWYVRPLFWKCGPIKRVYYTHFFSWYENSTLPPPGGGCLHVFQSSFLALKRCSDFTLHQCLTISVYVCCVRACVRVSEIELKNEKQQ